MQMNRKTGRIEPIESLNEIHRFLPELQAEVALKFFTIANVGSSEIMPYHWTEIARTIEHYYDQFEGFVVVHGTNTLAYTASALSFALQGLSKPVVLTGSLLPINDLAGDGRMNLIFAIRAAQLDLAEVCVVLGPRVLRANRVKKVEQTLFKTFDTPQFPSLADFNLGENLHPWRMVRRKRTLSCKPDFETNIMPLTLHPGISPQHLDAILDTKPNGILLRLYGPGMLPESLFPWIRKATEMEIPIVTTSQTVRGKIDLHRYRKQLTLEQLGIISGKNMTFECAITKLMWGLTQTKNPRKLRDLMERSLVGELDD